MPNVAPFLPHCSHRIARLFMLSPVTMYSFKQFLYCLSNSTFLKRLALLSLDLVFGSVMVVSEWEGPDSNSSASSVDNSGNLDELSYTISYVYALLRFVGKWMQSRKNPPWRTSMDHLQQHQGQFGQQINQLSRTQSILLKTKAVGSIQN